MSLSLRSTVGQFSQMQSPLGHGVPKGADEKGIVGGSEIKLPALPTRIKHTVASRVSGKIPPKVDAILRRRVRRYQLISEHASDPNIAKFKLDKFTKWFRIAGKYFQRQAKFPKNEQMLKELVERKIHMAFSLEDKFTPVFMTKGICSNKALAFPKIGYFPPEKIEEGKGKYVHLLGDTYKKAAILGKTFPVSIVSKYEADFLVQAATNAQTIPWKYFDEGCISRARLLAQSLVLMGVDRDQIFLQYHIPLKSDYWSYHVAVSIKLVTGEFLVLDPSLNPYHSMSVSKWAKRFNQTYKTQDNLFHSSVGSFDLPKNDVTFHCPVNLNALIDVNSRKISIVEIPDHTKYDGNRMYVYKQMNDLARVIEDCGFTNPYLKADIDFYKLVLNSSELKFFIWTIHQVLPQLSPTELSEIRIPAMLKWCHTKENLIKYFKKLRKSLDNPSKIIRIDSSFYPYKQYHKIISEKIVELLAAPS